MATKIKFRKPYDDGYKGKYDEHNRLPSLTIPNQSMTLREILKRFASGLPVTGQKVPLYEGEDFDVPHFHRMDKVDQEQAKIDIRNELKDLVGKISKQQAEEIAKKEYARRMDEFPDQPKKLPPANDLTPIEKPNAPSDGAKASNG